MKLELNISKVNHDDKMLFDQNVSNVGMVAIMQSFFIKQYVSLKLETLSLINIGGNKYLFIYRFQNTLYKNKYFVLCEVLYILCNGETNIIMSSFFAETYPSNLQ